MKLRCTVLNEFQNVVGIQDNDSTGPVCTCVACKLAHYLYVRVACKFGKVLCCGQEYELRGSNSERRELYSSRTATVAERIVCVIKGGVPLHTIDCMSVNLGVMYWLMQ
jgi:hypothetical protein